MHTNFERYHCQMALPGFGEKAQHLLQKAKVLIVGAGGLGCPAAQYLTSAGVGTIAIADDDIISVSNLHRQTLFNLNEAGEKKVIVACEKLQRQNPSIKVIPYDLKITSDNVMKRVEQFDIVIDGTDNFETKYLLNDACVLTGKPLIYGAIYQYEGQVAVWNVLQKGGTYSPNYRDIFPDAESAQIPDCSVGGVIPTLAGMTGCMQANETIKYLIRSENILAGKLWLFNALTGETRIINLDNSSHTKIIKLNETIPTITIDKVMQGMEQNSYKLIDVRNEEVHRQFNLGGINIPLDQLEDHLRDFTTTKPVVCYCATGKRSTTAARMIKNKYPEVIVFSLEDGIAKYRMMNNK